MLAANRYGKSRVRLVKVSRLGDRHQLTEVTVNISLAGDFERAFTAGDNSAVLPTDTMKNTVYALAKDHSIAPLELFAMTLARHFVSTHAQASSATVTLLETPWHRATVEGKSHDHSFLRGSEERATCVARVENGEESWTSGIEGLVMLKTANSGFEGFPRDAYTTLAETGDRLFGTNLSGNWWYSEQTDFLDCRSRARTALIECFSRHQSRSVQHTLHAMAEEVLTRCPEVSKVHLALPNLHCLLVDLSPFDLSNENEVFVPVDEPHGSIEATVSR